ncbi:MAG: hypothetical protein K8I82_19045, partial [Anaerolineae bacterium]|nr:hypothetical protein [Anaerolineae bacterium]
MMEQQQTIRVSYPVASEPQPLDLSHKLRPGEFFVRLFLFLCGFISIFTTLGIVFVLGEESILLFTTEYSGPDGLQRLNILDFLTGTKWQPNILEIGIWPLLTATLVTSFIAIL